MPRTSQARVFRSTQTSPNAGTARDLTTAFGTTANTATTAGFATAGTVTSIRWSPNVTATAATTIPSVGASSGGMGWRDTVAEHTAESVRYAAGTWTLRVQLTKSGQTLAADMTVRVTLIAYWVTSAGAFTAEIGRVQLADALLSTATLTLTGGFTTGAATTFAAGDKIQVEAYVQPITAGLAAAPAAAVNVNFVVDATSAGSGASFTAIPGYQILYARSMATSGTGTAAMVRKVTAFRTAVTMVAGTAVRRIALTPIPKVVTALGTPAIRRAVTLVPKVATAVGAPAIRKAVALVPKVAPAVGTAAMARSVVAARTFTVTTVGAAARMIALTPIPKVATAAGVAAMARRISAARTAATTVTGTATRRIALTPIPKVATAAGVAAMARSVIAARTFTTVATGVAGFARALIFGRQFTTTANSTVSGRVDIPLAALNRIIPAPAGDWPLTAPTTAIAGVTRNSAGVVVVSATVYLVRQVDGVRVASTTSHATTGVYSFTRGAADPYNYRVMAIKAGAPEVHGVSDLLVPA